jgi:hypothetical protein
MFLSNRNHLDLILNRFLIFFYLICIQPHKWWPALPMKFNEVLLILFLKIF